MTTPSASAKDFSLSALADGLHVDGLDRTAGQRVLLLGDATIPGRELSLHVASTHPTRQQAIDSIVFDGVNPLPRILADLDAGTLTVLDYNPVTGISQDETLYLTAGDDDRAQVTAWQQGLTEDLRTALGHYDD